MEDPNAVRVALMKEPEVLARLAEFMKQASFYFTDGKSCEARNIISK
jgi:hypothetical protein